MQSHITGTATSVLEFVLEPNECVTCRQTTLKARIAAALKGHAFKACRGGISRNRL
jgi:hypothetical protein